MQPIQCPAEIQSIIAEILHVGVLRICAAGWAGDADRCAVETDHLHNLPSLLTDFRQDVLQHYWDGTRTTFISESAGLSLAEFDRLWHELQDRANLTTESTASN